MKIIAHRGASNLAPQNTVAAFKKAVEIGAYGIETDVHLTKDGRVVLCHNYEIDETSNGIGKISDLTFEEIRKYDFGSKFSSDFSGETIPTLEEFLTCSEPIKKNIVEIKTPEGSFELVDKTVETVKKFGALNKTVFSSFSLDVLKRCKELENEARTAMLFDMRTEFAMEILNDPKAFCGKYSIEELHPIIFFISEDFVKKCNDSGIETFFWTVNDADSSDDLENLGVTGIITDVPELFLQG
ncbi:MAG: hypothetical protein IJS17_02230 [Clostridia bacterium]|nr:hypothetical protein [Clostridia bacterium]